jgi:hypothetical protein
LNEKLNIFFENDSIRIYIELWDVTDGKYKNMFVLVDPGARMTTFSEMVLRALGYSTEKKM